MPAAQVGIDLRLLGPVRAWRDGTEIALGSARRTAVLCVLAMHPEQTVSRDQLVTAVWGENPPPSATGNIYTYVSTLRQMLEPTRSRWTAGRLFSSNGGTYQLHVSPDSVDVLRFMFLRDTARGQRSAGDTEAELATVAAALCLWRGEALAGVPGPFAEGQRLRLAELRLATAERHVELLTANGRHAEAAELLRELVAAHPHREDLRAKLATLTPPAALLTSPPIGSDGVRPVGVPSADGRAVGEPSTGPGIRGGGVPARGPRMPTVAAGLFGRDAILRRIRRAVTDVAAGRGGGSILLEGPAGIGKTALLIAALRTVPDGCRIGWATGDGVTRSGRLGTLRDGVETALVAGPPLSTTEALAAAFFVAERADADQPDQAGTDGPDRGEAEAAGRAVELVRRAATEAPLILVIDDSHWADPTTLRAWAMLSRQTSEVPLLLVAAARSGARASTDQPSGEIITLGPLDSASAGALVRAVAPQPPDPDKLARMLDEAGGHPGYLRELAVQGGDPFPAAALVAAVNAHLAPYPEATRQVLRAVAFLSEYEARAPGTQPAGCTIAELAAATDQRLEEVAALLAPVQAAGILAPGERVRFQHRIVVRTLCQSTPAALRVTLCRRYAQRLAEAGTAPERVVALVLAGQVPVDDCAGGWLVEHVERVFETAPRIAVTILAQAHAEHALAPARRLTLTAWLARLLLRENRNAAAEAGWVAARTDDPDLAGEMRWIAAHSHERRGDVETAADIAHAALRERRIGPQWIERLRALLGRIRPRLPGNPTHPHLSRSGLLDEERPGPRDR